MGSYLSTPATLTQNPWRRVNWSEREQMFHTLKDFQASQDIDHLRILLVGPVGSGKSAFITSVDTALQGRSACLTHSLTGGSSFTSKYTVYKLNKDTAGSFFPFVFGDTMGLEDGQRGPTIREIQDILRGDIEDGYTFNGEMSQAAESQNFNTAQNLGDKIHCLVFVISAGNINRMPDGTVKKIKEIQETACELRIPVVVLMSKVDEACPFVKEHLRMIYNSTNIKQLMEKCSERLNVPQKQIFPVKNYHEETNNRDEIDVLIFTAVTMIVNFANDCVKASEKPWRTVDWSESEKERLSQTLKEFKATQNVNHLRILIVGPTGAGKSAFITSVNTALQGRHTHLAHSLTGGVSVTSKYTVYNLNKGSKGSLFPFVICDTMGLEDTKNGAHQNDLIKILQGHVKEGYTFNPSAPLTPENNNFNSTPTPSDEVHCLVFVVPNTQVPKGILGKMKQILQNAQELEIPVVVVMSKVDNICKLVQQNLKMIYRSNKVRTQMMKCNESLGIPLNYIFPVKNYHQEISSNTDMDILILSAVKEIVNFANDFVERKVKKKQEN